MKEFEDFLSLAIREFERLKRLADDAVSQLSEEEFFRVESEGDNSVAVIYKHMSGNMLSRWTDFLDTDGEKPWRNRDEEFVIREEDTFERLIEQWEKAWAVLVAAVERLEEEDVSRIVKIRGEGLTVLQAVGRQLTHYAYHVGQIVIVAKHLAGPRWRSLSIPLGKSEAFNRDPKKYI